MFVSPAFPQVVPAYGWTKVGAFARYEEGYGGAYIVVFPNKTRLFFTDSSPAVLEWIIVDKQEDIVRLNVSFLISDVATVYYPEENGTELPSVSKNITYTKTLFVDVNVYTRESFLNGEQIGKTCFWAEPYAMPNDTVTVTAPPSDLITGEVWYTSTITRFGKEIKIYGVVVYQLDPYASGNYVFDWHTGVNLQLTIFGYLPKMASGKQRLPREITLRNGTKYTITSEATMLLGEKLGMEGEYVFDMVDTNINLGSEALTEPTDNQTETTGNIGIWKYYPFLFVAVFTASATAFIIFRRKKLKHHTKT